MVIEKGKLVRWIDDKGFGFIKPENGENDIFIHISALKGMSRKPIIGDVIRYQISFDDNGKKRAVNAKIEGVNPVLNLVPIEQKHKTYRPSDAKELPDGNSTASGGKPRKSLNLFPIVIVVIIGLAVFIYRKIPKDKTPTATTQTITQKEQFQCEGKVWCTEMSSYEEAKFYLDNCPDTKMDGGGDGIPCERQFNE